MALEAHCVSGENILFVAEFWHPFKSSAGVGLANRAVAIEQPLNASSAHLNETSPEMDTQLSLPLVRKTNLHALCDQQLAWNLGDVQMRIVFVDFI